MHRARRGPSASANGSMANTTSRGRHDGTTRIGTDDDSQPLTGGAIGAVTQRGRHVGLADQTTLMEAWPFVDQGLADRDALGAAGALPSRQ